MKLFRSIPLVAAALLALAGCGGGSGGSHSAGGRGSASLSVTWPKRDRTIPVNADVIKVTVTKIGGGATPINASLTRSEAVSDPASGTTVTEEKIGGLDPGTYKVTADAYADGDATHPLATGLTDGLVIVAGQSTPFIISMNTELSRFRVSDQSTTPAFTPAVFYIDSLGVTSDGSNRVTPTYNSRRSSTDVIITPQSASQSDLLLLPTPPTYNGDPLIEVTGTDGLSGSGTGSTSGTGYLTTINYVFQRSTVGSLTFNFRDYEAGALTLLKSFSTAVQLKSPSSNVDVTFSGLPSNFDGSNYRITATLKENAAEVGDPDQSPAATYIGTVDPGTPNTARFANVQDRNRGFKVDVKLEIVTDANGFADLAVVTGAVVDVTLTSDVAFPPASYYSMALATNGSTLPTAGVARDGTTYGPDPNAYSLRVRINGSATPTLLNPSLFAITLDSGSGASVVAGTSNIKVANDVAPTDVTATFRAKFARPTGTVDPLDLGTFNLLVKKNTGTITVGIK